ncbi:MAG TPA: GvpL/GvpF family gas vesicle protein [Longimicrobiales bacterium]|nr:GvpL/GvpF family gas vesicle protein [Longimicrobiales bacterium]
MSASPGPRPGTLAGSRPRGDSRDVVGDGLYLFGITRSRSWRAGPPPEGEPVIKVRYRDLDALVRPVPYRVPELSDAALAEHQRMVDGSLRKGTILPAPFGLVFRGRRAVIRLLEDQYIVLDEGLAFLDNHWELRLHVAGTAEDDDSLSQLATHLYSELRRFARAAIPLRAREGRLLSAAFLVERGTWIEFIERTDDLEAMHPELSLDVTGPWPPYDFVRILT